MEPTERYTSMAQVRAARERLRTHRDAQGRALQGHWAAFRKLEMQQVLIGNAARGVVRGLFSWRGAKDVADSASPGIIGSVLGMAFGGPAQSIWRQALIAGLSTVAPVLWEKFRDENKAGNVLSEVDRSWQRVKDYVRERRDAHQDRSH